MIYAVKGARYVTAAPSADEVPGSLPAGSHRGQQPGTHLFLVRLPAWQAAHPAHHCLGAVQLAAIVGRLVWRDRVRRVRVFSVEGTSATGRTRHARQLARTVFIQRSLSQL